MTGAEAVLSGPTTITMSCDFRGSCGFFGYVPAGSYTLEVMAPGFQAANVPAMLTVAPSQGGCPVATLQPSALTLNPSGGPDAALAAAVDDGVDCSARV